MSDNISKKIIFSGIQPTGVFTLGNYLGAVRNWEKLQDEYQCIYSIVNMHAITVRQNPADLRKQTLSSFALLLACGIDPQKSLVFIQSHVKTHSELAWILSCNAQFGELSRMTQFKDKSQKYAADINVGLFTYPVLMAADILLYGTDLVPVGADQKQHLELARNIATRFNHNYSDTFTVPEPYIAELGAKIMSLQEPTKKMSKSDENPNACVRILDDRDTIIRKFKKAVTDSDGKVVFHQDKPGVSNLMTIYSAFTSKTMDEIEKEFNQKGYGDFKLAVGEAVADGLEPIQTKYNLLMQDKENLEKLYTEGAKKATSMTYKMMRKVNKKVGFIE